MKMTRGSSPRKRPGAGPKSRAAVLEMGEVTSGSARGGRKINCATCVKNRRAVAWKGLPRQERVHILRFRPGQINPPVCHIHLVGRAAMPHPFLLRYRLQHPICVGKIVLEQDSSPY